MMMVMPVADYTTAFVLTDRISAVWPLLIAITVLFSSA